MFANNRRVPAGRPCGRTSVTVVTMLVLVSVATMVVALTLPGFPSKVLSHSLTAGSEEIEVAEGAPATVSLRGDARGTTDDINLFVNQQVLSLDHSVLNNPDILPAPNPAPMSVAAYE